MLECHARVLAALRDELLPECTMARFDLLANLDREDGQTLASLSRNLLVTAGNLTGLVDRAARDGLVVKRSDARDRRVSRAYLTRKGRSLVQQLIPQHARAVSRTLSPLTAQEQNELRRILGKLRERSRTRAIMIAPKTFRFAVSSGVAEITLDRADRLNALTFASYEELTRHVRRARPRRSSARDRAHRRRPRVLLGRRRRRHHRRALPRDMKGMLEFTRITGALIENIRKVRRPVIAAVNGTAVGAGAVIALACDLRIASEKAKFGFIFPSVGLSARTWARRISSARRRPRSRERAPLLRRHHRRRRGIADRPRESRRRARCVYCAST